MDPNLIALAGQVGFPVVMAMLVWRAYERVNGTLIQVVKSNTEAMLKLAGAVDKMEDRVTDLESQTADKRFAICPIIGREGSPNGLG